MNPVLSILCASRRTSFLDRRLLKQVRSASFVNQVEFLMLNDNDWRSTGKKRQILIELSRGQYVMFVDDDDILSARALPLILDKLDGKADTVTFNVRMVPDRLNPAICIVKPDEVPKNEIQVWKKLTQYKPWHYIMPTKRELYEGLEFIDESWGEDTAIAEQMRHRIKKFHYIKEDLYLAFPLATNQGRKNRSPRYETS